MEKCIVTTSWDDGHILDTRLAALLQKYNIQGTFYISPKDAEFPAEKRLSRDQILEISKNFEIGAHTMTHPDLTKLSDDQARNEISDSKEYLESVVGKPIRSFCYPSGKYTSRDKKIVKEAGFNLARTVKRFKTSIGNDTFAMPTSLHAYDHWLDAFQIAKVASFNPYTFFRYYRHWDELAKAYFDITLKRGGVYHLWGHSWEIDKNNDWDRLEEVLRYISNKQDVQYVDNSHLVL